MKGDSEMKKITAVILVLLFVVAAVSGCGSSSKNVDLNALMDKINTDHNISGLKVVEDTSKLKRYFEIEESDVKQFAAEYASDASVYQAVILVEAVDADAASRIATSLDNHLDSQISEAKSYSPESEEMLSKCKVSQNGNFVCLIIGDDAESIQKEVDSEIG